MELIQIARRHLGGDLKKAAEFVEYTERRAHLLIGRGGLEERRYTFPHRTFQEYLAACHLASGRRFPQQAAQLAAQGDTWREVLNLAAGTLVFNQQDNWQKVLDGVAEVTPKTTPAADDESGWYRVWLAGEMAVTAWREEAEDDEVGREVLPRLRQQLAALLEHGALTPVQRAEAGVALGWLGDPRPDVACGIPAMVEIPARPFLMGSDRKVDKQARDSDNEEPQHKVDLPVYAIGKYPVTVAQFRRFVDAGGYDEPAYWTEAGWEYRQKGGWTEPRFWQDPRWTVPNHPVVGVSWYEAVAYCNWLKAMTGDDYCLPSEAMWEKAARGADGRIYPWGNEWKPANLNAFETGIGQMSAVGMFPNGHSLAGIFDLSGNVWEWTSSRFGSYPYDVADGRDDPEGDEWRVLRGGSFNYDAARARAASRGSNVPGSRHNFGFRVVVRRPPSHVL
jgi:formylglycine-generating enzyme required for sulfatase activity